MRKQVFIISGGIGSRAYLTRQASAALKMAGLWIGPAELLQQMRGEAHTEEHTCVEAVRVQDIHEAVQESSEEKIAVLMGDAEEHGTVEALCRSLSRFHPHILPGISRQAYFAARLGLSLNELTVLDARRSGQSLLPEVKRHKRVMILHADVSVLEALAASEAGSCEVFAGEFLGTERESLQRGPLREMAGRAFASDLTLCLLRSGRQRIPEIGIADEEFERGTLPMTKSEVRAIVMSRLMLNEDDVVYDIGSGTGSVSVEMALKAAHGTVYAIEQKAEGAELVLRNAARFGLRNIHPVTGRAPEALSNLPFPDAAFIGGSSGELKTLFQILRSRNPQIRIVVTAVTIETVFEASDLMEAYGMEPEIIQVQISRSKSIGTRHMLLAQNPVYVISGGGIVRPESGGVG